MKKAVFTGVGTAIITPFTNDGINYEQFDKLIEWQIQEGVNALVVAGTTGESSTLGDKEHIDVIEFAVKKVNGRVPVIAGTGSNDTAYAINLTKEACSVGADACLVVTPYYNKCTQNGLIKLYTDVADASSKPIILYNVPSRTNVNIEPSTYAVLADHPNICGIKEANGNIKKIVETMSLVGDKLAVYSGSDDHVVPILACGGSGVISVMSNIIPKKTVEMCDKFFAGDLEGAMRIQCELYNLSSDLFIEPSPAPIKAVMAKAGWCNNILRAPLLPMEDANYQKLSKTLRDLGINV